MGFTESLKSRERAFEEEFFARRNRQLAQALHEKLAAADARADLAAVTGIHDQAVLSHLLDAGLSCASVAALSLYPLVAVAWADRRMADAERAAILSAAHETGGIVSGSTAHELLEQWLTGNPGEAMHRLWLEYATALVAELDPFARRLLRDALIGRAQRVAEAAGALLGLTDGVSTAEREVLAEVAAVFDD